MTDLLLLGAGGHGRACIDVVQTGGAYRVRGIVGLPDEVGTLVLGVPVIGEDADLPELLQATPHALVTVGQIRTPEPRRRLFEAVLRHGGRPATVRSAHAVVSAHADLGAGTIVMHAAVVNAGAQVGRNVILNTRALVEHDVRVGDHCHISTGAILNGSVTVEDGCFVGSGAVVREGVTIGAGSVIGAGVWLDRSCPAGTIKRAGS